MQEVKLCHHTAANAIAAYRKSGELRERMQSLRLALSNSLGADDDMWSRNVVAACDAWHAYAEAMDRLSILKAVHQTYEGETT